MIATVKRSSTNNMSLFMMIWFGQVISYIGSGMSSFALCVWVYQKTRSITQFALTSLFIILPRVALGPLAGALVDRWDRRRVLIISDAGGGFSILAIGLLFLAGRLEIWHIYLAIFMSGIFDTLRWPAMTAATTQLVPKEHFGRASGMLQIVSAGTMLISPFVAGSLMGAIGLQGVIVTDFETFLFAILTILLVRIPRPETTADGRAGKGSLLHESTYGWKYIVARSGLLSLLVFLAILFMALIGLRASVPFVTISLFLCLVFYPITVSSNQAIWQSKVAPDMQGRVFAIRQAFILATPLLAYLVTGPLADKIFEPLLQVGGPLAGSLGQIIGVGPGRGAGLLFISMGSLLVLVTAISYLYPQLRLVEDELPDAV